MLRIKRLHDHVAARAPEARADQRPRRAHGALQLPLPAHASHRGVQARRALPRAVRLRLHRHRSAEGPQRRGRPRRSATTSSVRWPRAPASCVREVDVVARYGGEEFLVVLPSTHFGGRGHRGRAHLARGHREALHRRRRQVPHAIAVSVGVGLYPSRDVRTKDALRARRRRRAATSQARWRQPHLRLSAARLHLHARARRQPQPRTGSGGGNSRGSAMTSASFRPRAAHPDHAASRHHRPGRPRGAAQRASDARALGR